MKRFVFQLWRCESRSCKKRSLNTEQKGDDEGWLIPPIRDKPIGYDEDNEEHAPEKKKQKTTTRETKKSEEHSFSSSQTMKAAIVTKDMEE